MSKPQIRRVAAAVVRRADGKTLLLKRALTHQTFPGKWCFVTGYIEEGEDARMAAVRELREELDILAQPAHEGAKVIVNLSSEKALWVFPFLFEVDNIEVRLDREHADFRWIAPDEVHSYDTVPQLADDLKALGLLPE